MDGVNANCTRDGDRLIIKITGEIDHHSAKLLREVSDREIIYNRPKTAVIDLSGVDFMDSSGLGFILGRYNCMSEMGGNVEVINPSKRVEKILTLSGVQKLVTIKKTKL